MLAKKQNSMLIRSKNFLHSILKTTATLVKITAYTVATLVKVAAQLVGEIIPEIVIGLLSG